MGKMIECSNCGRTLSRSVAILVEVPSGTSTDPYRARYFCPACHAADERDADEIPDTPNGGYGSDWLAEEMVQVVRRMPAVSRCETYNTEGMLTRDFGFTVQLINGAQFCVTVKRR